MSRKDYIAMAQAVGGLSFGPEKVATVRAIAAHFAADNARFDRARFLTACGVE